MKKLHKIAVLSLIVLTVSFTACSNVKVTETKQTTTSVIDEDTNYTVTTENNPEFLKEPTDEELRFFDSLEEALKVSKMNSDLMVNIKIKDIIKIIENDNGCVCFIFQNKDNKDFINTYKLRKKVENEIQMYSEPIYSIDYAWQGSKSCLKSIAKRVKENELLKYKVISDLQVFNYLGNYNIEDNNGDIKWGSANDPKIKNLTINGQKPTKIIELKMDGDNVYFWYYENLEVDYDNIMDMEILY